MTPPFPVTDHGDGRRFFNPPGWRQAPGFSSLPRWWWQRLTGRSGVPWPRLDPVAPSPPPPAAVPDGHVAASYIGQATFLLQLPGLTVLTDPVFAR